MKRGLSIKSYQFKVVIIGDYSVGKSTLISKFVENKFRDQYIPTLGVNISRKSLDINDSHVDLMIWDIAGQDMFSAVRQRFYQESEGYFIVFDTTRKSSLEHLGRWYREVLKYTRTDTIPFVIVANKIDLKEDIVISDDDIISTLIENEMEVKMIIKTSAKDGTNVEDAFEILGKTILKKYK